MGPTAERGKRVNRTAETTWDWDWDGDPVDRSLAPARLTPDGELEPIAVDESLTTLLFSSRKPSAPVPRPEPVAPRPVEDRAPTDLQVALFEMA
jgi:hypothetical protein